jgi:hypothetical protein
MAVPAPPNGESLRRQLTLFVPEGFAPWVEPLRLELDPVQRALIAAHVTLCREDEIVDLDVTVLHDRLAQATPLALSFGPAQRFGGHGVLLPCIEGTTAFQQLRVQALGTRAIREPEPHLTLAHPRNSRAPGNEDWRLSAIPVPLRLEFHEVALIEQRGAHPWVVLDTLRIG